MTKAIVHSSVLMTVLGVVFALAVFLTKTLFEDARALGADFRSHELEARTIVSDLRGKDAILEARVVGLDKKMDEANRKLDFIIERSMRHVDK